MREFEGDDDVRSDLVLGGGLEEEEDAEGDEAKDGELLKKSYQGSC